MNAIRCLATLLLLLVTSSCVAQNPFSSSQPGYPKWSAFTGVRWQIDRPWVEVEGKWYELKSIHGVTVDEIIKHAESQGWELNRRFAEDLVQMLRLMGKTIDRTTDLELSDENGQAVVMKNVAMSEDNLRRIRSRRVDRPQRPRSNPFLSSVPGYPDWSPFEDVRWKGEQPSVKVNGIWYEPVFIHGVPVGRILQHSRDQGWRTERRFREDIVQMIRLMGHKIDKQTTLVLRDSQGKTITLKNVEMKRVAASSGGSADIPLTHAQIAEDIDAFARSLAEQFAYLQANNFDYESKLQSIKESNPKGTSSRKLGESLNQVMMSFIDGHASVQIPRGPRQKYLSFTIESAGDRFVAINSDGSDLLQRNYPFIRSINGVPIGEWLKRTEAEIAKGSPQMVRSRGLRALLSISRYHAKAATAHSLNIELVSRDGKTTKIETPVSDSFPRRSRRVERESEIMDGNIAYLRLPRMDSRAVEAIREWMPKFRDTDGLIIDMRDNGGGIRTPILELAPYLMSADDQPRIGNVAKYRLAEKFEPDHLTRAAYVYPVDSPKFDQRTQDFVKQFASGFKPQWDPPAELFSEWHYLVLSKSADDKRYQYKAPVVILMNVGCFSATDIFLSTFKGWPGVTLVGQPSGGGSARSQSFQLPSGIQVRCASMASFQPDGKLYDGNGVQPDVLVELTPEYFVNADADVMLEAAKREIATQRRR